MDQLCEHNGKKRRNIASTVLMQLICYSFMKHKDGKRLRRSFMGNSKKKPYLNREIFKFFIRGSLLSCS